MGALRHTDRNKRSEGAPLGRDKSTKTGNVIKSRMKLRKIKEENFSMSEMYNF